MRRIALPFLVVAFALGLTATALAAPTVLAYGASNPVAWAVSSLQQTTFFVKSPAVGAYTRVEVLSHSGVVAVVYAGALGNRPLDSAGRRTFPAWNGKDAAGRYLPTGNYAYRIRLTQGGLGTTVSGVLAVSRARWTIDSRNGGPLYKKFLFAGPVWLYFTGWTAAAGGDAIQAERAEIPPATGVAVPSNSYPVAPGSPVRNVLERWTSASHRVWNWQIITQDPTTVGILTVIQ